jgi:hypothetical protein
MSDNEPVNHGVVDKQPEVTTIYSLCLYQSGRYPGLVCSLPQGHGGVGHEFVKPESNLELSDKDLAFERRYDGDL